jgi:hypothetical protein
MYLYLEGKNLFGQYGREFNITCPVFYRTDLTRQICSVRFKT